MRLAVWLAATLFLASCGGDDRPSASSSATPFAQSPGTIYAPRFAPTPSPRGVAPIPTPAVARASSAGPVGPVCGDARLIGRKISPISGSRSGCGIAAPVRVVSVSGVPLTAAVRVNCETAKAFADWVDRGVKPAARRAFSSDLASIKPVASYSCRPRNNKPGARLSEHSFGNAIDVAEFGIADGRKVSLLSHWRVGGPKQAFLRSVWKSACGPFGTVLGPEADRYHQDHFHFDIARYRSGPYCE